MSHTSEVAAFFKGPFAITHAAHAQIGVLLAGGIGSIKAIDNPNRGLRWYSGDISNDAIAANTRSASQKSVAVMSLYGIVDKRSSWMMDLFGGTSTDTFGSVFDNLIADPQIKGIVIDVDSPGGAVTGTPELSKKIFDARESKPIVAVSNAEMDSAAYWIGSSAHKVFVTPSANTGSIGVWSAAMEVSKAMEADGVKAHVWRSQGSPNKAPFLPYQEFSAEAIAHEQTQVDQIYGDFISAVARNRGVTVNAAQKAFGQGKSFMGKDAVDAGLADRVSSLEEVIARMQGGKLTLGSMENINAAFADEVPVDESWREMNETERMRSRLKRRGVLTNGN